MPGLGCAHEFNIKNKEGIGEGKEKDFNPSLPINYLDFLFNF